MKSICVDLSSELESIEIHTFADLHIGDPHTDIKSILERIAYVEKTPNAYIILNGDICNMALKTSVSDTYGETLKPMEQIQKCIDLFGNLKDRILCVTEGNHEARAYKTDGISIMALVCAQLDIQDRYAPEGAVVFVKFGHSTAGGSPSLTRRERKMLYSIYVTHGSGGGRKEGGKAIRLADMASIVDCDCYIHSHTHLPMIMKQSFFRTHPSSCTVETVDKLFINTSAMLDYGSYGQAFEFKPSSKDTPVIYLYAGRYKKMLARL